jgi:hypothetical protein
MWAHDKWWGSDKLEHLTVAILFWGFLTALPVGLLTRFIAFTVGAVGIELLEWLRYYLWKKHLDAQDLKTAPGPWPFLADFPSYRDLAWDYAGALISFLIFLAAQ